MTQAFTRNISTKLGARKQSLKKERRKSCALAAKIRGVSKWHYLKRKITFALIQIVLMQMMHQRSLLFQIICGQNALLVSGTLYTKEMGAEKICPHCGYSFRIGAWERLAITVDEKSFHNWDSELVTKDPLNFPGYLEKIEKMQEKLG